AVADDLGDAGEGRQVELVAIGEHPVQEEGGTVGDQVADRGHRGGAHHEHLSPVVGAAYQGDGVAPAAHRLDVGVEGGAAQQRVRIQQQAGGVATLRGGLRTGGGDDDRGVGDGVVPEGAVGAAGDLERRVGEGAVQLLGGAGGADDHGPHLGAVALGAAVAVLPPAAHPAVQRSVPSA